MTIRGETSSPQNDHLVTMCVNLRRENETDPAAEFIRVEPNPARDRLLNDYRRLVNNSISEDARVNLTELDTYTRDRSEFTGTDLTSTPVGADALARLRTSLADIVTVDPYIDAAAQEKWWYALHQFYLDGLDLADRLLRVRGTDSLRSWRRLRRRAEWPPLSASSWPQMAATVADLNFPHTFRLNPWNTYLPSVLHIAAHHLFPGKPWRFNDFLESMLTWVRRGGFCQMAGVGQPAVSWHGVERLRSDHLFDTRTWRTRHNIILTCAHRFGLLDGAVFYKALRGIRLCVWADDTFYGPAVTRKIARDRYSIAIRGSSAPSFRQSIADTADVLVNARTPVLILVDGGQPPLFYGQQMSIKDGVRLAARAAVRASSGTGRRTYVVPISLNDPCGFVQGRQRTMRCTFHTPILIGDEHRHRRRTPPGSAPAINNGDPLLNYLEALYILNTTHAKMGLPHPRVLAAARHRRRNIGREPVLKRFFQTSWSDLATHAGMST